MNNCLVDEYLNNEMILSKDYKKFVLGSGCFTFLGIAPAIFMGLYWLYIGIVMLLIFVVCVFITFRLACKELTLKSKIKIQAIIYICWYSQIGLFSAIVFIYAYGVNYNLIFLYLPSLLFCLFLFVATSIMIKTGKFSVKRNGAIKGLGFGFTAVVIGWRLASILDNSLSDDITVPIILSCFTFVNTLLSSGFLNFQKLYYLQRHRER